MLADATPRALTKFVRAEHQIRNVGSGPPAPNKWQHGRRAHLLGAVSASQTATFPLSRSPTSAQCRDKTSLRMWRDSQRNNQSPTSAQR